jgi:hypothetical protein
MLHQTAWYCGLVGYDISLTPRRSPVRARAEPHFLALLSKSKLENYITLSRYCSKAAVCRDFSKQLAKQPTCKFNTITGV